MGKFDSPSKSSAKREKNSENVKSPSEERANNWWNNLTGKYKSEKENLSTQSRAGLGILRPKTINRVTAGERLTAKETAQKIQSVFGAVNTVLIPRTNGTMEVATRKGDSFYFAGATKPCFLDRGEQALRNTGEIQNNLPSAVTAINSQTRRKVGGIFSRDRGNSSESKFSTLSDLQEKGEKIDERQYIEKYIPKKWHQVALDFIRRKPNALSTGLPIAIASARSKMGLFITKNGVKEFPIIIGEGGTQRGSYLAGTPKTPTDIVVKFNGVKIATSEYGDASKSGSNTVKGAALFSSELADAGGKWWHGVADYRVPNGATHGCVGMRVSDAREIASVIRAQGGGYGFVSDSIQVG